MNGMSVLDLWRQCLIHVAVVSAPFLIAALVVGVGVALIQTATQIQEQVLVFVPKLVAALVVLALGGHFLLDRLGRFTTAAITAAADPGPDLVTTRGATRPGPPAPPAQTAQASPTVAPGADGGTP